MPLTRLAPLLALAACAAPSPAPASAPPASAPPASASASFAPYQPAPAASSPPASASPLGPACERYLSAYERCEPALRPEIMAGNRRSARAERGWFEHVSKTPEGAGLEPGCVAALGGLPQACR